MPSSCSMPLNSGTRSARIGKEPAVAAQLLIGTVIKDVSTCPCQGMLNVPSNDLSIQHLLDFNMLPILGMHLFVEPKHNLHRLAPDTSDTLSNGERQRTQQTLGTFLFHARAVDMCMLKAIGSIATKQAQPTVGTMNKITWLLNYAATWNAADFHGMPRTSMECRGLPWNSVKVRGIPRTSVKVRESP